MTTNLVEKINFLAILLPTNFLQYKNYREFGQYQIFGKNRKFGHKMNFWSRIEILVKN